MEQNLTKTQITFKNRSKVLTVWYSTLKFTFYSKQFTYLVFDASLSEHFAPLLKLYLATKVEDNNLWNSPLKPDLAVTICKLKEKHFLKYFKFILRFGPTKSLAFQTKCILQELGQLKN